MWYNLDELQKILKTFCPLDFKIQKRIQGSWNGNPNSLVAKEEYIEKEVIELIYKSKKYNIKIRRGTYLEGIDLRDSLEGTERDYIGIGCDYNLPSKYGGRDVGGCSTSGNTKEEFIRTVKSIMKKCNIQEIKNQQLTLF